MLVVKYERLFLFFLFQNLELLKQFISPYTGHVESYSKTGKYFVAVVVLDS